MYIPIKYSYQKLDLNLQRFFANLAWKILNKHILKIFDFARFDLNIDVKTKQFQCLNQEILFYSMEI